MGTKMTLKEKYGSWALVTGASSGIGEEFARRLASENLNLILAARRIERLEKLSKELIEKHNIKVVIAPVDLSKKKFMDELKEYVGKREVGLLVNNAGFGYNGEFVEADPEIFRKMIKVNCIASTEIAHYFGAQMAKRKKGAIIFLGSLVGYNPTPLTTVYSATKAFNLFMGEALWYELKKNNVDVLALNPGGTATEFQQVAGTSAGPVARSVEEVVNTAMKKLGKRPSVVDGFFNKVLTVIPRFITRRLTLMLAGYMRKKLYSASSINPK